MTNDPAESRPHAEPAAPGDRLLIQLREWLAGLPAQQPAAWPQLPDIGLYMDQVVTYIDRQLALHRSSAKEHVVTSAMVNNYIKDGLLPRAELKKYAPAHLALLTMVGALKPVLSMQDLQILLGRRSDGQPVTDMYGRFLAGQQAAVAGTAGQVSLQLQMLEKGEAGCSDEEKPGCPDTEVLAELRRLALDLAIEARVRILVAEQLLTGVAEAELAAKAQKNAEAGERGGKRKEPR